MLQLLNITKSYDGKHLALAGVDLTVAAGEIVCLLGPSGCGKSTLLRIVAGLEQPDGGRLLLHGEDLLGVPVHRRNFGLMFQEFALFPHRTVFENIAFGLRMAPTGQRPNEAQIRQRVGEMLALVNLEGYGDRSIFALSGGERQRVALARSLAPNPRLLMLDEPLGSLDRALREALMTELRTILKRVGVTALYVSHDQQEALAVADRLVVMNQGCIEDEGTPQQVYGRPANEFVARFLGFQNLLPAVVQLDQSQEIQTPIGKFILERPAQPSSTAATLLIRPQAATVLQPNGHQQATPKVSNIVTGELLACSFRGEYYRVEILVGEDGAYRLVFHLAEPPGAGWSTVSGVEPGRRSITLALDPAHLTLLA
jgi:ABC-type Fe3+/spermidine/putrescine transport system ATPase subunit